MSHVDMLIAIDFDGTIAEHHYPEIGPAVPGAFFWMQKFKEAGATLQLWTMRSDRGANGPTLKYAVDFCKHNGIEFEHVNINPHQQHWTDSPKMYAHVYIDDAAFGCPLIQQNGTRAYVDWSIVGPAVLAMIPKRV